MRCEGGISSCVREKGPFGTQDELCRMREDGFMYVGCVRMGSCM